MKRFKNIFFCRPRGWARYRAGQGCCCVTHQQCIPDSRCATWNADRCTWGKAWRLHFPDRI